MLYCTCQLRFCLSEQTLNTKAGFIAITLSAFRSSSNSRGAGSNYCYLKIAVGNKRRSLLRYVGRSLKRYNKPQRVRVKSDP